jgi:hypothetical protein
MKLTFVKTVPDFVDKRLTKALKNLQVTTNQAAYLLFAHAQEPCGGD